jgi:hypothetical protein
MSDPMFELSVTIAEIDALADAVSDETTAMAGNAGGERYRRLDAMANLLAKLAMEAQRRVSAIAEKEHAAAQAERLHREEAARATRILDEAQRLDREESERSRREGQARVTSAIVAGSVR